MKQNNVKKSNYIYMLSSLLYILGGETTSGGEMTRGGGNDYRGNVLGAKQLGEEMVWGRNIPDSFHLRSFHH